MKQGLPALSSSRPPSRQQAVHALFHNREFKLLWFGQLLSQVGDQCLLIAAITLISSLSQSPMAMLIPAVSLAIPQIAFGLLGGVMADRWNRKLVRIGSDVLRGLIVLSVLFVRSAGQLWILCLAAAGLALVGVFFYPARNAVIPNIVPLGMLLAANSLIQGSYVIALIALGFATVMAVPGVKAAVGLVGGAALIWMGVGTLRTKPGAFDDRRDVSKGCVLAGVTATIANPYWFVWWVTVGAALVLSAGAWGLLGIAAFAVTHWLCDLGWLTFLSWGVFTSKRFWTPGVYRGILIACAAVLAGFGVWFILSGIKLLI